MVIYVNESGSDRQELIEELVKEGVTFKESSGKTTRESSTAGWRTVEWKPICRRSGRSRRNLPRVTGMSGPGAYLLDA
jgi:hypothetical protein